MIIIGNDCEAHTTVCEDGKLLHITVWAGVQKEDLVASISLYPMPQHSVDEIADLIKSAIKTGAITNA